MELTGNYRQMGRQYGMLLRDELTTLYHDTIEEFFMKQQGVTRERLQIIAQSVFDLYPAIYEKD